MELLPSHFKEVAQDTRYSHHSMSRGGCTRREPWGHYFTATVTPLVLMKSPILTIAGKASAGDIPAGTSTLIWVNPATAPGAAPAYFTTAFTPRQDERRIADQLAINAGRRGDAASGTVNGDHREARGGIAGGIDGSILIQNRARSHTGGVQREDGRGGGPHRRGQGVRKHTLILDLHLRAGLASDSIGYDGADLVLSRVNHGRGHTVE
jgi:hypothetical protein